MTESRRPPQGRLCIWTGIDPAHELDFNRWYDREHMQERVAIPGFRSARRLAALDPGPRPYLALYDTDDLSVFGSDAYRRAFSNQTEWSLRNFARMRDTQRRVGALTIEAGEGEGGALAMFVLPPGPRDPAALRALLGRAVEADHVVRATLLETDVALSTPLTAGAPPAPADALVKVEATRPEVARAQAASLAGTLGVPADAVHVFTTLWRLGA
ncbi:MAG TPA: hypothetical protein VEA81_08285 [Burkholderiaceae bacterium]|nr:hypothetical protein [Burkholderiaceae bacterium]